MMTTVILALAVPGLLAVMYLGLHRAQSTPLARSLAHARGDTRGIALQTVIIIVVLLAIAGAIAAVLLSRGAEVASDLEQADVSGGVSTAGECASHEMGGVSGTWSSNKCTWTGAEDKITSVQCQLVGGTRSGSGASTKCELTVG